MKKNPQYILAAILILLFLPSSPVFSQKNVINNNQKIIPLTSEVYTLIDNLSVESGYPLLSTVRPYSESEIIAYMKHIDYSKLSIPGKNAYAAIKKLLEKHLTYKEDSFAANSAAALSLETYLHTSADESGWQYGYEQRKPFFSLPVETWFNEGFYAYTEIELKQNRYLITEKDSEGKYKKVFTNVPLSYADLNYHYPVRAFFSAGGDNWNMRAGRDKLKSGNGKTGQLVLSSDPDYYDFILIKGFSDVFSFTWIYANLESWSSATVDDGIQRAFIDHIIETRLFNKLTLYLCESMLMNGLDPEIQFVNPLIIYHNLFMEKYSNSLASAGFSYTPVSGLKLYGEMAIDQVQTYQEQDLYGESVTATPNADGFLTGIQGISPAGEGYLSGQIEYVYTSPWLYIREGDMSFIWSHRELTDVLKSIATTRKPIGYLYGPDSIVVSASAGYEIPGTFSISGGIDYILKGENTITTQFRETPEAAAMTTPSGIAEKKTIFRLEGKYTLLPSLTIGFSSCIVHIKDYNHIKDNFFFDFQNAAFLTFTPGQ